MSVTRESDGTRLLLPAPTPLRDSIARALNDVANEADLGWDPRDIQRRLMSAQIVRAYHERTKHAPGRFARSLGHMDWDTQPDPFRRFAGAPLVQLDIVAPTDAPSYPSLFTGALEPAALSHRAISQLLFDSLALSAEKAFGKNRWWLRVNPSSGNLHPTEGYLVLPAVSGVGDTPFVYHYAPRAHGLEALFALDETEFAALTTGLPDGTFLLGLTSIHWREAWKYGERAYRYCQHDVGHAIAAVVLAAAALGWHARLLPVADLELATLLGVHGQTGIEREHPDTLLALTPSTHDAAAYRLDEAVVARLRGAHHAFTPNVLSAGHQEWPIIDEVAEAALLPAPPTFDSWTRVTHDLPTHDDAPAARRIIRARRSAVAMDKHTGMTRDAFYEMLLRTCPGDGQRPFDAMPWTPRINLVLFVHRVGGLPPGLYVLLRDKAQVAEWRALLPAELEWARPEECPPTLDLFRLQVADARDAAAAISCGQEIAGDGVFCAAMIADFDDALDDYGPWFYRHLHWEAGAIGQVLYLEAEAAGIRATGIGCFFDDLTHDIVGIAGTRLRTIYHFTVGGAVDDDRIQATDPYAALEDDPE